MRRLGGEVRATEERIEQHKELYEMLKQLHAGEQAKEVLGLQNRLAAAEAQVEEHKELHVMSKQLHAEEQAKHIAASEELQVLGTTKEALREKLEEMQEMQEQWLKDKARLLARLKEAEHMQEEQVRDGVKTFQAQLEKEARDADAVKAAVALEREAAVVEAQRKTQGELQQSTLLLRAKEAEVEVLRSEVKAWEVQLGKVEDRAEWVGQHTSNQQRRTHAWWGGLQAVEQVCRANRPT